MVFRAVGGPEGSQLEKPLHAEHADRIALTNHRMIFLWISKETESNAIKKLELRGKIHYSVQCDFTESRSFFPIEIKDISRFQFRTQVGKPKKLVHLNHNGTGCDGNPGVMTVALRLPPWGRACEMEIAMSEDVDFDKVRKTIATLYGHRLASSNSAPVSAAAKSHGCNASAAAPATAEEDRTHRPLFETKTTDKGDDTGAAAAATIASADEGGDAGASAAAIATADKDDDTGAGAATSATADNDDDTGAAAATIATADEGHDAGAAPIAVRMVDQCSVGLETK